MHADLEGLREFAKRYTAAWCGGDPGGVAEFFAPGGSLTINGGAPAVGRKAIAEAARSFMTAFPDLRVSMDDVRLRGDRAEYHWTLIGTNTGPGGTGARVQVSGFELWQFDAGGLIGASLGHFDQAEYDRQMRGDPGNSSAPDAR
jgi:uncharacterized protein (TIGR02246 family)